MASTHTDAVAGAAAPAPADAAQENLRDTTTGERAVEMSDLPGSPTSVNEEFKDALQQQQHASSPPSADAMATASQSTPTNPQMVRKASEALGPATDAPIAHPSGSVAAGPTLNISLMLITGARHPYRIDEKYLRNRKVLATNGEGTFDPREISGYQLKELIWTDWRSEWEPRPASPSSIRLIILGRMIEDKLPLKDFPFNMENTNVVHMTVKPADLIDDEEAGAKGTGKSGAMRTRDGEDRDAGCRCVIF